MLNATPREAPPGRETQDRILDTAERLFAERGIDGVSVRAILAEAGVNAALANYHFGSREGLIDALLRRRLAPLNEERARLLDEVEARGKAASVEDVLRAFFAPAGRWVVAQPDLRRLFAQMMCSPNPDIRAMHRRAFGDVVGRFAEALAGRLPAHVTPMQLVCRFFFTLGTSLITSANGAEMAQFARERFGPEAVPDADSLVDEMVAFCAAGLETRSSRSRRRSPRRRGR
jgi:AcrR family transcriptional regulator